MNANNHMDLLGRFVVNGPLPPQLEEILSQNVPTDTPNTPAMINKNQNDNEIYDIESNTVTEQNLSTSPTNGIRQHQRQLNRTNSSNRNNVAWLKKQSKNKHLPTAAYLKDLRMHR